MKLFVRYVLIALSLVFVGFLLWYVRNIVLYVIIAWILSLMGDPVVDFFSERKIKGRSIPRGLIAGVTVLFIWVVIIGVLSLIIPLVASQAQELSNLDAEKIAKGLEKPLQRVEDLFSRFNVAGAGNENVTFEEYITQKVVSILSVSDLSNIFKVVASVFGDFFIAVFSISFIAFFFLKEERLFSNTLLTLVPTHYEVQAVSTIEAIRKLLSRYFIGISIEVSLVILLIGIGLLIVGISFKHVVIIAIFAGTMNIIPYIGPIIGTLFGILLGIVTHLHYSFSSELLPLIGFMLIVFLTVQLIDNMLFQPLIYSSSVNAHPLEIFLVIMVAGNLVGAGGMILAIPLYTVLRVILKEFFNEFKVVKKLTRNI